MGSPCHVRTAVLFVAGIMTGIMAAVWLPFAAITLMAAFT
mgnify:CR=1 FL=1